jgi:exopolysaccharide/PEP-CTERM locus tyrosine autokinase
MSKIQEALRRIQHTKSTRSERPGPQSHDDDRVATLARVSGENSNGAEPSGKYLTVDRKALRAAGLLAPEDQEKFVADQYRIIKRPLLNIIAGKAANCPAHANLIMVASALPGDGKTFNAINLALSIAIEKDTSILMVDADVAKPHISKLFGVDDEPGLIDVLEDSELDVDSLIISTDVPGLSILPAGRRHQNATELLASRRMAHLAAHLSEKIPDRVVLFDSPPLLATSESRVLANSMGQIALVVCAGKTPQQAVLAAAESLGAEKATSIILNRARSGLGVDQFSGISYGYGYGYGSSE